MNQSRPEPQPGESAWHSRIEAAHRLGPGEALAWDEEADLVVVGFGGAGVAAALQAVELGAQVVSLDRFHGGGATEASGGVFYAGGGTSVQKEAGVEDDPENMLRYLKMETDEIVAPATLRDFCERSPETVDWMRKHGVKFQGTLYAKKTSYPGVDYFLYHSDNSLISPYNEKARPAARGHRGWAPPEEAIKATSLGGPIYRPMRAAFEAAGGKTVEQSEARQLILDAQGRVVGVKSFEFVGAPEAAKEHKALLSKAAAIQAKWPPIIPGASLFLRKAEKLTAQARALEERHRRPRYYRARRGVVLAAGGFIFNRGMVGHYAPKFAKAYPLGTPADQGDGIRLGQTAGGAVGNMDRASMWRFINPPIAWSQGIVVNRAGKRFVNESSYGAKIGTSIALDQEGEAWSIVDARLAKESLQQINGGKVLPYQRDLARLNFWFAAKKAKTIEALGPKIGVDAQALVETIAQYNEKAGKEGDEFGKSADDIRALENAPFYAIDIGVAAKLFPSPTITLGGLKVDEATGAVIDDDGEAIDGLFAAGRTAVGVCSWNYLSGLSIADCIYAGRRAARSACGDEVSSSAGSNA